MSDVSPRQTLSSDSSALADAAASPRFGTVVLLLVLGWLVLGTQIPQGIGAGALGASHPHGWVALIVGLGLDHIWSSWVLLFLFLLLFLHGVARLLAPISRREDSALSEIVRLEGGDAGQATEFVHRHLTPGTWAVLGDTRILTRGWLRQGIVTLVFGVLLLIFGVSGVERERMDISIGERAPAAGESPLGWAFRGGEWQPEGVGIALACGESQRLDPRHLRMCRGRLLSGDSFTGPLGIGHPLRAGDWSIRVISQSRSIGEVAHLVAQDARSMKRTWTMVQSGSPLGIEVDGPDGVTATHPTTVLPGRFGVSATSLSPEGDAWIHGGVEGLAAAPPVFLRGEGRTVLRVESSRNSREFWLMLGGGFCLFGFFAMLLVPHCHVSIVPDGAGGHLVQAVSLNRPWRLRTRILAAVESGESLEWRTRR